MKDEKDQYYAQKDFYKDQCMKMYEEKMGKTKKRKILRKREKKETEEKDKMPEMIPLVYTRYGRRVKPSRKLKF